MSGPFPARFLVAGQDVVGALPRRKKIEVAELLRESDRLIDHALELVVITHFNETGQREILAQRMALEAVIGEDPTQIGMARKYDAIEGVSLALIPIGTRKHFDHRRHRRRPV